MSDETNLTILETLRRGVNLARENKFAEAEVYLDLVLTQRPNDTTALMWKAVVAGEKDPTAAIHYLERVLVQNPDNKRARDGLQWARHKLENSRQSASVYNKPPTPEVAPLIANPVTNSRPTPPLQVGEIPPYRKNRLESVTGSAPALKLPPEAAKTVNSRPGTPDSIKSEAASTLASAKNNPPLFKLGNFTVARQQPAPKKASLPGRARGEPAVSSSGNPKMGAGIFGSGLPQGGVSVSPKVARKMQGNPVVARPPAPLRWSLALFGLGVLLTVMAFPLNAVAPVLGGLAAFAALAGMILLNRAKF